MSTSSHSPGWLSSTGWSGRPESLAANNRVPPKEASTGAGVFWIHIASFSVYNDVIGYLLVHREGGFGALTFFFVAMALHFLVNDQSLKEHHRSLHHKMGRWLLAGAVVVGWTAGAFTEISEAALATLVGFLAGGMMILSVLKEELPEERESRFSAFVLSAAVYSMLLLTL